MNGELSDFKFFNAAGEEVFPIVPDHREKEFLAHQLWIKREIYRCTFSPYLPPTPYPERPFPQPATKPEGE